MCHDGDEISFLAPSTDRTQFLKFEGNISQNSLTGHITHVDAKTKKPVSKVPPQKRSFARADFEKFNSALPQNKNK